MADDQQTTDNGQGVPASDMSQATSHGGAASDPATQTGTTTSGQQTGGQDDTAQGAAFDEEAAQKRVEEFLKSTPPPEPRGSAYKQTEEFSSFATTVALPAHTTVFDEKYFLYLFGGSLVLQLKEKKEILERLPKLSQFQVDEFVKILEEEKQKFDILENEHPEQIQKMRQETKNDWELLEMETHKQVAADNATNEADEIRKKLGLA